MVSKASSSDLESIALSREAVIDHALAVADLDGLGAVSIRRIAQDFGVTPMALYWHVKNKDELLAAMGDRVLDAMELPDFDQSGGIEELRPLLTSLVEALRRHPGCTSLAMVRALQSDSGRKASEKTLDILRHNGFNVQQSADLARAGLQTAIMLVSGRPGAETTVPQAEREDVLAYKRSVLASLPTDRFPNLVECADALTECPDEGAYYGTGIDLYMAGVLTMRDQHRLTVG